MTKRLVVGEALAAACVFAAAAWWGTSYWNASWLAGRAPQFYQEYLEPAVMIACGHGFVVAAPGAIPSLSDFLLRKTDRFSCADVPSSAALRGDNLYQAPVRYLMVLFGWTWRLLGVSWSGLGPLAGLLFSVTTLAAYGVFRLGMGRALALFGTFAISVSALHLLNLPHLRDYVKAPFTLLLVFILGLIVKLKPQATHLVVLAVAYGVVLGVGYGIRTDLLIAIPPLFVALFLFLDGGLHRSLTLKAVAAAAFSLAFAIAAWPILTSTYQVGGCQAHVTVLGLNEDFTQALDLRPAPYDWGGAAPDMFAYKTIASYAHRVDPRQATVGFCTHDYDVAGGRYLSAIVSTVPGDFITRAYASALQIVELPFPWHQTPLAGRSDPLYGVRDRILTAWAGTGLLLVATVLVVTSAVNLRLAGFLLFFLVYFGGYPAVQFANRHHFHLEFITWWAFGFLLHQSAGVVVAVARRRPEAMQLWRELSIARAAAFIALTCAAILVPQAVARWYQSGQARQLLSGYLAAPRVELPLGDKAPGVLHPVDVPRGAPNVLFDPGTSQFLEVDVNTWRCGSRPTVTLRYEAKDRGVDFSRTFVLVHGAEREGVTRLVAPVYDRFQGIEFGGDARPECIDGLYRIDVAQAPALEMYAVLRPRWEREPLYQRIGRIARPSWLGGN